MDGRFSLWLTSVQGQINELLCFRKYLSAESFDREIEELIKAKLPWPSNYAEARPVFFALDDWITRGILSRIRTNNEDEDMIILDG